jgi:hypothetical protein
LPFCHPGESRDDIVFLRTNQKLKKILQAFVRIIFYRAAALVNKPAAAESNPPFNIMKTNIFLDKSY